MTPFWEALFSLWLFLLVMIATPGPANMLALSVGARAHIKANKKAHLPVSPVSVLRPLLPFIFGLTAGKLILNMLMAVGLPTLLVTLPEVMRLASWAAAGWLIWLSLQGWQENPATAEGGRLPGFWQAVLVHPLNPKAWVMLLLAWTEIGPQLGGPAVQWAVIPASFAGFQLLFHSLWALGGAGLGRRWQGSLLLQRGLSLLTIAVIIWAVLLA